MAKEVRLPQLGQTMEEGTIVDCMVNVGDEVKKGDIIFEVETDKATLEVESPADGFVKHILVEIDQTLPVGEPLLVLAGKDEEVPQSFIDSLKAEAPAAPADVAEQAKSELQPIKTSAKPVASPRAKKLAKELRVNLNEITGTGPAGRITEQDVKNAASKKPEIPAVDKAEAKLGASILLNRLQRITAERMLKSKREIPCFYLTVRVDVTDLVDLRTKLNKTGDVKTSYHDFIIHAVAIALQKFPVMTGQLQADTIKLAETINIGLAVSVPDGLIVPVVKDAHKKSLKQIAEDTKALIEKAKNEKLLLTDLEGACITVSNLGAFGIDSFIPVVIPGQCSIIGVGQITDTCVPHKSKTTMRKLMNLTLSADHKITDGAYAAQFLDLVKKLLEDTSTFI
jgi:pyruvate dehydrogenase E2 component (dihydrolipoamide acetyltransferase)